MFWGLTLEHGSVYSQVVDRSFHLSMAALGFDSPLTEPVSVAVEVNKARYVLCTLQSNHIPHQQLNHEFTEGEELCFYIVGGSCEVHLTGFVLPTPIECEYDDLSDNAQSTSESESEEIENEMINKQEDNPLGESASYRSFLTQLTASVDNDSNDDSDDESDEEEYVPGKKKTNKIAENNFLTKKKDKKAIKAKNKIQVNNKIVKQEKKRKIQQFKKKKKNT